MTKNELDGFVGTLQALKAERQAEYLADRAKARDALAEYWAGSASASVARDYRAGRVRTVKAGRR